MSRAEEGLYVAVLQYSKGGDVVHAFQIFVEEVCFFILLEMCLNFRFDLDHDPYRYFWMGYLVVNFRKL